QKRRPILWRTYGLLRSRSLPCPRTHAATMDLEHGVIFGRRDALRRRWATRIHRRRADRRNHLRRARRATQIHLGGCPYSRRNDRNYVAGATERYSRKWDAS